MQEVFSNSNFKRSDVISAIENIASAKTKIAVEKANHHMDVYDQLDNTQKVKWLKMGKRMLMMKGMDDEKGHMDKHKMMKNKRGMSPKNDIDN